MSLTPDLDALLAGDRLALARTISQVEDQTSAGEQAISVLFLHTGKAHRIGITGSPGTGKSTLTAQLARAFRKPPDGGVAQKVGILAIDPTSPFSGGAVLGDRVRMRDLAGDEGIFIRSMASRGELGGLSVATSAVSEILDAAGFSVILIETVGAGQDDVSIAGLADTTIVVEAPDLGDEIQAIKAGILEIADILVLNKADLPGTARAERALRSALDLADSIRPYNGKEGHVPGKEADRNPEGNTWRPPLVKTIATQGSGTPELYQAIQEHKAYLHTDQRWETKDRDRLKGEVENLLRHVLFENWRQGAVPQNYQKVLERVFRRECSPIQAVQDLLRQSD